MERTTNFGEAATCLFQGTDFDGFEDKADPIVELFVLEAAERFAEREITDDVEGCEVTVGVLEKVRECMDYGTYSQSTRLICWLESALSLSLVIRVST